MKRKAPKKVNIILLAATLLIPLFLIINRGYIPVFVNFFGSIQKSLAEKINYTRDSIGSVRYIYSAREGINALKERLILLTAENNALEAENNRLSRLLSVKSDPSLRRILRSHASVIGVNDDGFIHYYLIDRGRDDGVEEGDGVLAPGGIAGRVVKTENSVSKVQLLSDVKSNISVRIKESGVVGILSGNGHNMCLLNYVSRDENVRAGDEVVTSGLGKSFPEGLPVGVITHIEKRAEGLAMVIYVKPHIDVFKPRQAVVIRKRN